MALPTNPRQPITPSNWEPIYKQMAEFDCWYSGDLSRLANHYAFSIHDSNDRISEFWAQVVKSQIATVTHVPIAGDISSTSAALLFSEHPKIKAENPETQARLDEIISLNGFNNTLLEAAEVASALGGVFLKLNWDSSLANYPIISIAQPDTAWFDCQFGIITGITFSKEVAEDNKYRTYRLLEYHTPGRIENALYVSRNSKEIGDRIPLNSIAETADLQDIIDTGITGLAAWYVPNIKPNKAHRGLPVGASDYQGILSLMNSLDEAMTSLIRSIRLGQMRIYAPEAYFQKKGNTFTFDTFREAYMGLNIPIGDNPQEIKVEQAEIRAEEHINSALNYMRQIYNSASYSPQSFGLDINGQAESGTALNIRERKSFITTAKKAEYWQPVIRQILEAALIIDRLHLRNSTTPSSISVEMQDSVKSDISTVAIALRDLSIASAISTYQKVKTVHPDWEEDMVTEEVDRILNEQGLSVPNIAA